MIVMLFFKGLKVFLLMVEVGQCYKLWEIVGDWIN